MLKPKKLFVTLQNEILLLEKRAYDFDIVLKNSVRFLNSSREQFLRLYTDTQKNGGVLTCLLGHVKLQETCVPSQDLYHLSRNRTTLKMSNHRKWPHYCVLSEVCVVCVGQRLCLFSAWPCDIILICPVSVSQDVSGQGQSIRSQKRKRSIDTSKHKAKPGIIEEPNRGSNVRPTEESKIAVTVEKKFSGKW